MTNNLKQYLVLPEDKWRPITLQQHSRIATLSIIENAFTRHLDGFALREVFLRSCMGHFLLMHQEMHFSSVIVNSLLQSHIERPNASRDEMHFLLGRYDVRLSREEFCLITGLKFGQTQKPTGYDKTHEGGLIHRHFTDHEQIRVPDLIYCLSEGEFHEGMDIVKLSMLIMKHNFLWGTDVRRVVPTWEINFVDRNMDGFNAFPWGARLFRHCLHRWKSTLVERTTKHINLGGFSYALLVFAFEVAPDIALLARRRPDTAHLPRICHWEFTHSLNYPKRADAKEPKLFQAQMTAFPQLQATGDEQQRGYYVDLDQLRQAKLEPPRKRRKKKDVGHHAVAEGQVMEGDEGRDVQDDVPEQADVLYEQDVRPDDPVVQEEVSVPKYGDVPLHIPTVVDQTNVIDAVGDLGYTIRPPERDHEAPMPTVRADEANSMRIPLLQRPTLHTQQIIELREQVTAMSQQLNLYRAETGRRFEELEHRGAANHADIIRALDLYRAEIGRRLDELERRGAANHADIMRALAHVSRAVSFMPTTAATSPVSGRPQTSPTIGCSDQITGSSPVDTIPIDVLAASDPVPLPEGSKLKIQEPFTLFIPKKSKGLQHKSTELTGKDKRLLILDVDGILADVIYKADGQVLEKKPDLIFSMNAVFKRPHCDDFISFILDRFAVGVWSSRKLHNVLPIVKSLFPDLKQLVFGWAQEHCIKTKLNDKKLLFNKELTKVWNFVGAGKYNETNTLLLDNSPYKSVKNPENMAILLPRYTYNDPDDSVLGPTGNLRKYLNCLAEAENMQEYMRNNPIGQETNPDKNWEFLRNNL